MRKKMGWIPAFLASICTIGLLTAATPPKSGTKPTPVVAQPAAKATQSKKAAKAEKPVVIPKMYLMMFKPLPKAFVSSTNKLTAPKINLGRMLYYDVRLSKSHKFSCNSCHLLDKYGVDNKPVSNGHKGAKGDRNSPTVYNAASHVAQFWDGRSPDIEDQARHPILNPVEMAAPNESWVVKTLQSIPGYVKAFKKAFPNAKEPVTYLNMARAIGAFERKLVTPSRWDAFLKGNKKALTQQEKRGFMTFFSTGCISCHTGQLLGGHMYQKLGLVKPWPGQGKDLGRYKVNKNVYMKMFFKVPSLRNVEKTGPYLHDGSIKSLSKTVQMMGEYQLGRKLTKQQIADLVAFLKALTGKIPTQYIKPPKLPASTKQTPQPSEK